MDTTRIAYAAQQAIDAFGATAHTAIDACRTGGERLGHVAGRRWDAAFEQARPRLSADTRRNAAHARSVFSRHWSNGLRVSTSGAQVVLSTLVGAASIGVDRAAALAQARTRS